MLRPPGPLVISAPPVVRPHSQRQPETLLDTYEEDRLPVMRDVLFKTEY
jgi:hypothetical protein